MPPRLPFALHRLRVKAWLMRKQRPAVRKQRPAVRKQAGKALLADIKHYLDRMSHDTNLP